jgi:hypothetical protein
MPEMSTCVVSSLAKDPDLILVGCHIRKYIMTVVNTEAEQVDIQALVIPDFASKTMYSSHVCPGSFIPHTRI